MKPRNSLTGLVLEAAFRRIYNCTTSSPAREETFSSSAEAISEPFAGMTDALSSKPESVKLE